MRLRSRSQHGRTTYAITTRHYVGPEPVETRMQLNYREYISYIKMADRSRAPINKERRCFMYGKQACFYFVFEFNFCISKLNIFHIVFCEEKLFDIEYHVMINRHETIKTHC